MSSPFPEEQPPAIVELLASTELPDIAKCNLVCASELPGSESLDVEASLARIDELANAVASEIHRNYHHFVRNPAEADYSQAKYCALMMVTVLQKDFGVRYNPERIRNPDFRNAGDLFIHGMLNGNGGTCASMPVLYVAIGRRLGWPMKLVHGRAHLFCRWDDPQGHHPFGKERFNLEATGQGGHFFDDDYYRTWPEPVSDEMVERFGYLKSLSPEAELADFLVLRGHCLEDNGWIWKGCISYRSACQLTPDDVLNRAFWEGAETKRQLLIERDTLLDYFGPDVPLPFGYFPRHVLREMAAKMAGAIGDYYTRINEIQQKERDELQQRLYGHIRDGRSNIRNAQMPTVGFRRSAPRVPPPYPVPPIGHSATNMGFGVPGFPSPQAFGAVPGMPSMPGLSDFGSPFGHDDIPEVESLPARMLRNIAPHRLEQRRQAAVMICRSLPPGVVIRQPIRLLLNPSQRKQKLPVKEN